jgi:hypothetical protein
MMLRHEIRTSVLFRRTGYAAAFLAGFCVPWATPQLSKVAMRQVTHEVMRVTSPDMQEDAVLLKTRAGLLQGLSTYDVFIVPHHASVAGNRSVLSATDVQRAALEWRGVRTLEIAYQQARIDQFRSYWPDSATASRRPAVEIRLAPLSDGFSHLRAGGLNRWAEPPPPAQ